MNLKQIIATLSILYPPCICLGMDQSKIDYTLPQSAVNAINAHGEGILICSAFNNRPSRVLKNEQSLQKPDQASFFSFSNRPSRVLEIVEKNKQLTQNNEQNLKKPDQALFIPSYRSNPTYQRPAQKIEPKKWPKLKNYQPPTHRTIIYIDSDNTPKEVIEID